MIDITTWMTNFLQALNHRFENRVWFVGLQGSYGRGEATETSDIDIVVILDELSAMDIQDYHDMLDVLPQGIDLRFPLRQKGNSKLGAIRSVPVLP